MSKLLKKSSDYTIVEFPADDFMLVRHWKFGRQLWAKSKMTRRHNKDKCAICGRIVGKQAYRPLTNSGNRMERICLQHENLK